MKKFALAISLAFGVFSLAACTSNDENADSAKSTDNSEVVVASKAGNITKEEFYQELKDRYGENLLQEMVVTKVLADKYEVTDQDVDAQVQQLKDQYGDQFNMVLQQNGFTSEDDFRRAVHFNLLQEKAATEDIKISDEAIQKQYDRMKTEIRASHILVDSKEKADDLLKQIKNGADFAKLAKENSTGPSAPNGGDLDFFGVGQMDPAFEDAAYNLEVGGVSEPVQTQYGWHIIKVTDKRDAKGVQAFDKVKDQIKRQLANENIDTKKAKAKIDQMIKDANIDIKIDQFKGLFKDNTATK